MKWPTIVVFAIGLAVASGCARGPDDAKAYDDGALERLYRADLARANDGEPDAMMRLGRYYDAGLSTNDRCAGAMAPLCRIGPVSRWLAGTVVARDRARAYKWYSLAGIERHRNALAAKRSLIPEMTPSEIDDGERLIADWLESYRPPTRRRAANRGS